MFILLLLIVDPILAYVLLNLLEALALLSLLSVIVCSPLALLWWLFSKLGG